MGRDVRMAGHKQQLSYHSKLSHAYLSGQEEAFTRIQSGNINPTCLHLSIHKEKQEQDQHNTTKHNTLLPSLLSPWIAMVMVTVTVIGTTRTNRTLNVSKS